MKRLLWVGDAGCPSGFARATHEILDTVRHEFDVTVLGINYRGDPHSYPYPIYTAHAGGDFLGIGRLVWMCDLIKPDLVVIQSDPWNVPTYVAQLHQFAEYAHIPIVGAVAVDGKNCAGKGLNGLSLTVFWTQFGLDEAREGGFTGRAVVIPLGVDTDTFQPMDRYDARLRRGLPRELDEAFIVGNVNRNQPRKRLDLTIKYFARWVTEAKVKDAYLFLHVAPTGDTGCNVKQFCKYYGVADRLLLVEPPTFYGISDEEMRDTYNCFDVQVSTTQGEGFGLTQFEGMSCQIAQIAPRWAALGELLDGAAYLVPCPTTATGLPYPVNVIGGVADEREFALALSLMYNNPTARKNNALAARERALLPRYRWSNIGEAWVNALQTVEPIKVQPAEQQEVPA